ncbi:branched-chain amino acid ABC transporter substrate-binding protein [Caballeronia sordidicola]|uniref:branched-chain amino acid ABC transporter substrate-binding protein n=1 Tax=Caballeronia sordidicola TaxID=196367 RepID=UPI001F26AA93|nr:branched-chain amino acid ABC transporter substrate-binding protein [Caballeronia sordidicola]
MDYMGLGLRLLRAVSIRASNWVLPAGWFRLLGRASGAGKHLGGSLLVASCVGGVFAAPTFAASQVPSLSPIRIAMIEGMSGPFANAGAAVERNLRFGVERVNANGGVTLPDGKHPLQLVVLDGKGSSEASLVQLRAAIDQNIGFVMQGNSSAVAAALIDAINKQNARDPEHRVVFLNYSADDPALTNADCSFWHFRFDAHAGMRMNALADVIQHDQSVKKVYLFNQDYSFGHDVSLEAQRALKERRPDIAIVADEFIPAGRVKDFAPYIAKIRASGADAVITGNWGNDLTLLVKAAREQGLDTHFYTFYGNSLGAPAALGDAGVKHVVAVADWHPNAGGAASDAYYEAFRARFPAAADDYLFLRMPLMIEMLAQAMEKAHSADPTAVARALEGIKLDKGFQTTEMRAADHQLIQPLYVMEMDKAGSPDVHFDNEGSGFGFRTLLKIPAAQTAMPTTCQMKRPAP